MIRRLIILLLIVGCEEKIDNEKIISRCLDEVKTLNKYHIQLDEITKSIRDTISMPAPKTLLEKQLKNVNKTLKVNKLLGEESLFIEYKNNEKYIFDSHCSFFDKCYELFGGQILDNYKIIKSDNKRVWAIIKHHYLNEDLIESIIIFTIDAETNKISNIKPAN